MKERGRCGGQAQAEEAAALAKSSAQLAELQDRVKGLEAECSASQQVTSPTRLTDVSDGIASRRPAE